MAVTVNLIANANTATAASSLTLASYTISAANAILVMVIACDNGGTSGLTSLSGASVTGVGSLWGTLTQKTYSPSGTTTNDGVTVGFWSRRVTSAGTSQDTITFTNSTTARKCIQVYEVLGFPAGAYGISGLAQIGAGATTALPTITDTTGSSNKDDVMIGFWGREGFQSMTADSDTLNGTWSAGTNTVNGTALATSMALWTQYKIGTFTGSSVGTAPPSQTFNPTAITSASVGDGIPGIISVYNLVPISMAPPTIGTITNSTIALSWVAPYGHSTITDYVIQYRVVGTTPWTSFGHTASTSTSITVISLNVATTYEFNIAAVALFTGPTGAISASATTTGSLNAPPAPSIASSASAITASVSSSVSISVGTVTSSAVTITPSASQTITASAPSVSSTVSLPDVLVTYLSIISTSTIGAVATILNVGVFTGFRYLRPSGDTSTGSWTVSPLWSKVDESIYDDSDFITSEVLTSGTTSIAKLALTLV